MSKALAVIPARGGSKRIPRKNIKDFLGKPVIAYSIQAALDSGLFAEVMVSTDDAEIAEVAKKYGANVPFLRSSENSNDSAGTADVLIEVINSYKNLGKTFSKTCCIYPVAPLISVETLKAAYDLLEVNQLDNSFPVCEFSNSIWRALKMGDRNRVEMIWPENENKRTQDLPPSFHDVGQFYWLDTKKFIDSGEFFTEATGSIVLDELHSQDIDTPMDWKMAEIKYKIINDLL
ncbi:pseudaminic acid cytidylyltransferase [Bdellovibrio bacteriovorus]|uniref:pseudaminic acid cytidylyltransferase n=1 Tax=Bdellovibrio bacteriovorus TaxID=959 RepID=UPI0035A641BB